MKIPILMIDTARASLVMLASVEIFDAMLPPFPLYLMVILMLGKVRSPHRPRGTNYQCHGSDNDIHPSPPSDPLLRIRNQQPWRVKRWVRSLTCALPATIASPRFNKLRIHASARFAPLPSPVRNWDCVTRSKESRAPFCAKNPGGT